MSPNSPDTTRLKPRAISLPAPVPDARSSGTPRPLRRSAGTTGVDGTLDRAEALIYVGDTHKSVELTTRILASDAGLAGDTRARCLLIRAAALRLRGFLEQALQDAKSAMGLLDPGASDPKLLAQAHKQVGIPLAMRGDLEGAIAHFETALESCARIADLNLEAEIHQSFGVATARLGRFAEAQVHYQSAAVAYEKVGRHADLATLLNNKGRLHHDMGEYTLALDVYDKSIDLARQFKYARTEAMALVNRGDALREMGDLPGALAAYRSGLDIATVAQEPRVNCCANIGIGVAYRHLGQMENALFHLDQAIYEASRLQLGWELADARLEAGILAVSTGRLNEAEKPLGESLEEFGRLGAQQGVARASIFLIEIYRRTGRKRELTSILETLNSTRRRVAIDRKLIRDAEAHAEALRAAVPYARPDGLLAAIRRAIVHPGGSSGTGSGKQSTADDRHDWRVQVHTLGACRVALDGNDVPATSWESHKAQELFVLLLCRRNGKTAEELLDILWSEGETFPRRDVIHNNVYRVRKALYKSCVLLENGHYEVNPAERVWFDLDEFRRLSNAAAGALYSPRRVELLTQAISLYSGEFLSGFYSQWILDLRRQTELQYLANLASLASAQVDLGRIAEARATIGRIEDIDPTNEQAQRLSSALGKMRA